MIELQPSQMSLSLFVLSLTVAALVPLLVMMYLRPILVRVMRQLCDADSGAEFWVRCAYILACSGTLLLVLLFGDYATDASAMSALRRALICVFLGVFVTVALISRSVWSQVINPARMAQSNPHQS